MPIAWKLVILALIAALGGVILFIRGPEPVASLDTPADGAVLETTARLREIRYDRDIRPILSDRCFLCHGPDEAARQADLRLDLPENALADRGGRYAIVPGNLEKSELWRRINETHPGERMPPPDSPKRPLSDDEKEVIRQWVLAGAAYEEHWSFVPPTRPEPPVIKQADWARNDIDRFILARLEAQDLEPSPEAEPAILLRRLFLDLTGLPPTPAELAEFLADPSPQAYERWVDRLLSQEPYRSRHAERMAVPWLDQARYADTSGIHMDAGRSIWPWRDWVLGAYRDNMPFDQFVTEQLAGDLLPDATVAQKVASGFHRNHVTSDEGGAIDEEYLVEYAVDRVSTTGSVFLGLTLGCARCHDHKFDPVTQDDFYGLFAFFNSNQEPGIYSQLPDARRALEPFLEVPTPAQVAERKRLEEALAAVQAQRDVVPPEESEHRQRYIEQLLTRAQVSWQPLAVVSAESKGGAVLTPGEDGSILASGANPDMDEHRLVLKTDATGLRLLMLEALADPSLHKGRVGRSPNGNAVLGGLACEAVSVADPTQRQPVKFVWAWADIEQQNGDYRVVNLLEEGAGEGWAVDSHMQPGGRVAVLLAEEPFGFEGGTELHVTLKYQSPYAQHVLGRVRLRAGSIADDARALLPDVAGSWYIVGPFADKKSLFEDANGPEEAGALDQARTFTPGNLRWSFDPSIRDAAIKLLPDGPNVFYIGRRVYSPVKRDIEVSLGSDDGIRVYANGEEVFQNNVDRGPQPDQDRAELILRPGRNDIVFKIVNNQGGGAFFHRPLPDRALLHHDVFAALLPDDVRAGHVQEKFVHAWRQAHSPLYRRVNRQVAALENELAELKAQIPLTMVMSELEKPRETFVLNRGVYDQPDRSRPVERAVPASLGALPADAPADRLGLARWILSEENPLTARVTVNRLWEQFFGAGLVRTSEDLGMQGEWPSHPQLLDWLAVEFQQSWDVQAMIRLIVTSSTYRQSSRINPAAAQMDPENRLLAWFPRQRMSAEQIRDQALFVSGLLVEHFGGPSVKPYQPEGLWQEVAMPQSNTRIYEEGEGSQLWRRSLYTYWKRALPPPSMMTFDAPTREFCITRRLTTNTPLQALVLWNDPQYVEAARVLACRVLEDADDDQGRIVALVRRCTALAPSDEELGALQEALAGYRARYAVAPEDALALIGVGRAPVPAEADPAELAAWTMLAGAVIGADASISKN